MPTTSTIDIVLMNGVKAENTLKELQQTANRLNREIANLDPTSQKFVDGTKAYQQVTGRLKEVRTEVRGVTETQKALTSEMSRFVPFSGQIGQFASSWRNVSGAVGGATKGVRLFKTALISTGIGAFVALVGLLVGWLTKTQRGIELVSKVSAALGATFNVLIDRGYMLIDALSSIGKLKFSDGIDKMKKSVSGLTDEIVNETKQAWKLKDALFAIERAENDLILKRAASRAQIKELNKLAEDTTKSNKVRSESAREAIAIEQTLLNEQVETQKKRAANMLGLLELTDEKMADIRANGLKLEEVGLSESTEEERRAAIEQIAKIFELQESSLELQTTLQNKLNQINKDSEAQAAKAYAEEEKRRAATEAWQEAQAAQAVKDDQTRDSEIEKAGQAEVAAVQKSIEAIAALRQQNHEDQVANIDTTAEMEMLALDELHANRLISNDEYQAQIIQSELDRLQQQLALAQQYYGEESTEAVKASMAIRKVKADETAFFKTQEDQKKADALAAAQGTLGFLTTISQGVADMHDKESEKGRKAAITAARIQVIQGALNAYVSTTNIPIVGPVLAPIAAAAALVFGNAKVDAMQKVPKARYGTFLRGNRHSQGGIPIEAEDGEIVLTRNVGMDPAGLAAASDLNAQYGGIRFMESGGPVNPISARSTMASSPTGSASSPLTDNKSMDLLVTYMEKMDKWASTLQVHNNVQDTREGISVVNKLENDASF